MVEAWLRLRHDEVLSGSWTPATRDASVGLNLLGRDLEGSGFQGDMGGLNPYGGLDPPMLVRTGGLARLRGTASPAMLLNADRPLLSREIALSPSW